MRTFITFLMLSLGGLNSANAQTDADLAKTKQCMTCHTMEKRLVGPSFQEVASKYQGKPASALVSSITKGSKGKWGPVPMPANTAVSESEAAQLATWILKQSRP